MVAGVEGTAAPRARPPASHALADGVRPLDDTAESAPDTATSLMDTLSRRAIVMLLAQQTQQQKLQAHLDRIKAHFNATQEERAEMMRQMNVLRDMALEQAKKDDEVLKKYIAMI